MVPEPTLPDERVLPAEREVLTVPELRTDVPEEREVTVAPERLTLVARPPDTVRAAEVLRPAVEVRTEAPRAGVPVYLQATG